MTRLYTEVSGSGQDLLVLLHGMGTTAAIWQPFIAARPAHLQGRILALDLPGHGRSMPMKAYDFAAVAEAVARALGPHLADTRRYRILGHSYGGAVALTLASLAGFRSPDVVYGLGIKTVWTPGEVEGMQRLAQKSPRLFDDRADAEQWYRKVAGIADLDAGPDCAGGGVVEDGPRQWRLAQDPKVHGLTPLDMQALTRQLTGRFHLAYGADDTMVDRADLARLDPSVRCLDGGGHNIMVSHPEAVWHWLGSGAPDIS